MTIGSSDGSVYENKFHHALGIDIPVTGGNNPSEDNNASASSVGPSSHPLNEDKDIYLIRHGDTALNEGEGEERIRGWSKVPLNDDGIEEAHKTAETLKDKGITSLISSDLPRAKQTANIIGKAIGVTPTFTPKLRTWDMGDLTGKPVSDHEVKCAEHVTDKPDAPIPGGESFNTFKHRLLTGVSEAIQSDPSGKVGIVTHNSPERVLTAWDKAGSPEDGTIHTPTYLEKGEGTGGHQERTIPPSIHGIKGGHGDTEREGVLERLLARDIPETKYNFKDKTEIAGRLEPIESKNIEDRRGFLERVNTMFETLTGRTFYPERYSAGEEEDKKIEQSIKESTNAKTTPLNRDAGILDVGVKEHFNMFAKDINKLKWSKTFSEMREMSDEEFGKWLKEAEEHGGGSIIED